MEDYEIQEREFWAKLAEGGMSRSQMLRRSAAAAVGLTIVASPAAASAARLRNEAVLPSSGSIRRRA